MTLRRGDLALVVAATLAALTAALPLAAIAIIAIAPSLLGLGDTPSVRAAPSVITPIPSEFRGTWGLLFASLAWAVLPASAAALLAWAIASAVVPWLVRGRGSTLVAAALVPAFVPGYLAFWALWICVGPGTSLGDLVLRHGLATEVRTVALSVALLAWSVPFALVPILARRLLVPDPDRALLLLDDGGPWARLRARVRHDLPGMVGGAACASIAILAENVAFDLARIRTYGYELRTLDATGASPATVVALGWPGVVTAVLLLAIVVFAWRRTPLLLPRPVSLARGGVAGLVAAAAVVCLLLAPLAAVVVRAASPQAIREFWVLYGQAAATSAGVALVTGALVGIAAVGCALAWNDRRLLVRLPARFAVALWVVAAASPATLIAVGFEAVLNRPLTGPVYDGPVIVLLGLMARVGVVAAIAAPFAAALESRRARDLMALDGSGSSGDRWRTRRPLIVAAFLFAATAGAALAFGELAVTARLRPPGVDILATATLNAIHYQQPETVLLAASISTFLGVIVAAIFVRAAIRPLARRTAAVLLLPVALLAVLFGPVGCRDAVNAAESTGTPPLDVQVAFGSPGFGKGQFRKPRVVAVEPGTGCIYVIDTEARIQRFSAEGVFETEWSTPTHEQGCPVGISVHPDGRVFVSDTHYHRILVFDRDGRELARFGRYGKGPGEFIYPTDIAFHPDGRIYVAEYGSNDRVQVFDASFRPIGTFGSMGSEEGQFGRPQSIVFDAKRGELYVADSNNHRIVVTDAEGRWLRTIGSMGTGPGQLAFPRGLILVGDGTILVAEHVNHRVQHLDARSGENLGASLGMWGGPPNGTIVLPGNLQYPWDMDGTLDRFVVTDSATDRVVVSRAVPLDRVSAAGDV